MRAKRAILAFVMTMTCVTTTAAPAHATSTGGWPQYGYGATANGFNPDEHILTAKRVNHLRQGWSVTDRTPAPNCGVLAVPVVSGGRLFVATRAGIDARDATTGRKLWTHLHPSPRSVWVPQLAVDGRTLVVATTNILATTCLAPDPHAEGDVMGLDVATGAVRWKTHVKNRLWSLVIDRGVAVVGGLEFKNSFTVGLDTTTGRRLWKMDDYMGGPGVVAAGKIAVSDTHARAVDIATGHTAWQAEVSWSALAADPSERSFVGLGNVNTSILRVSVDDGRVMWRRSNLPASSPAVDRDRIYLCTFDGYTLIALDLTTGKTVWQRPMSQPTAAMFTVAGGVLWVSYLGERVQALDPRTGAELDATDAVENVHAADRVVVADGWLYVTDSDTLRAFH